MFNMMFAPTARVIVISSQNYNAENEYLIAAANGNEIHYFLDGRPKSRPRSGAVRSDHLDPVR